MNIKRTLLAFVLITAFIPQTAFGQTVGSYEYRTPDNKIITVHYVLHPNMNNETRVMFSIADTQRTPNPAAKFSKAIHVYKQFS